MLFYIASHGPDHHTQKAGFAALDVAGLPTKKQVRTARKRSSKARTVGEYLQPPRIEAWSCQRPESDPLLPLP